MPTPQWQRTVRLCLVVAALTGCASALDVGGHEYRHVLSIDADGRTVPMRVDGDPEAGNDVAHQVRSILAHVREAAHARKAEGRGALRIVLVIHGGLVSKDRALADAREALAQMGCDESYPIFINWDTGMALSYANHLFSVRGGESHPAFAVPTAPVYLLADVGAAATRLPVTYATQIRKLASPDVTLDPPIGWAETVRLDDREVHVSTLESAGRAIQSVVPGAARVTTTFALDAVGKPGYANMLRRARVLFLLDEDLHDPERRKSGALARLMYSLRSLNTDRDHRARTRDLEKDLTRRWRAALRHGPHESADDGGCPECDGFREARSRFADETTPSIERLERELEAMQRVRARLLKDPRPDPAEQARQLAALDAQLERERERLLSAAPLRITVIAHSMGTIVANELIRQNSDYVYDDIVYMGAACSIREFADTALVYVKDHPATNFYNLCLHPREEENDRYAYGALPFGSLLVWIDSFITEQKSALDRTLGSWNNIAAALPEIDFLPSDVRRRIVVKGFGRGDGDPRAHGDFNDVGLRFWEESFWKQDEPAAPPPNAAAPAGGPILGR